MTFIPKKPPDDEMWQRIKSQDIYRKVIEAVPKAQRAEIEEVVKKTVLPIANGLLLSMMSQKNKK
jgi:hypothetical protein